MANLFLISISPSISRFSIRDDDDDFVVSTDLCDESVFDRFVDSIVLCLNDSESLLDEAYARGKPIKEGYCNVIKESVREGI